jgi:putative transposase
MDKSDANKAAIDGGNKDRVMPIELYQVKHLNNIVEQDHRFVKRINKPMLRFKYFTVASAVLAGIELMHMVRKSQLSAKQGPDLTFTEKVLCFGSISAPETTCA